MRNLLTALLWATVLNPGVWGVAYLAHNLASR